MDESTKVMICLSAATAANCTPCFEHYFGKAKAVGLKIDEIQEAVDLASQVKKGAYITLKNSIDNIIGQEKANSSSCDCDKQAEKSCCG
jgi:alkylhydroperoxidase/carboxymuconolactone decarboxylase family protein YurZ